MEFRMSSQRRFEQVFIITKSNTGGFWLITNDIFDLKDARDQTAQQRTSSLNQVLPTDTEADVDPSVAINSKPTYSRVVAKSAGQCVNAINDESLVNKRMINKFYHDESYQRYDNNLAVFVRGIPTNITHAKLCQLLRLSLIQQKNYEQSALGIEQKIDEDIQIAYIDVNYHKQYAFVYMGNEYTLSLALQMGEFYVSGAICTVQRKRSLNGPRKFPPNKRMSPISNVMKLQC
jgi:hypothetical protein